ncbi:hypothetical protein [Pseudoalteromonas galatheae]|uniref:hypothetical protein n=1 Tax=Pseudoalteromonas galatheae TaxID=579562 RepID=UPI0030D17453
MNKLSHEHITEHDVKLMSELLKESVSLDDVAEKFEIPPSDVVQYIYPSDRYISPDLYVIRIKAGTIIVGDDGLEKRCSRCKFFFPIAEEFWHFSKRSADGFLCWCRECEKIRSNANRVKRKKKEKPL